MKTRIKIGIIVIFLIIGTGIIISGNFSHPSIDKKEQQPMINPMITRTISGENVNVYLGTFGNITFNASMPESPSTLSVYSGVFRSGDLIDESQDSFIGDGVNVPSEKDAPDIAKTILNAYGGLPQDAIFWGASTSYAKLINTTTLKERMIAEDTMVTWKRQLNNRSITGDNDIIRVLLGDNGNPLWVYKEWRTYTYSGVVQVIPVEKAIEKLENGDTIDQYLETNNDINIHNISLGYYVKGLEVPDVNVEPVWIFSGNTTSGSGVSFKVYARQFSNFTASPTSGKLPLTVTFTDTSDSAPTKWLWDFGDGTNSTVQNPAHAYTSAGTYNVSLKAWNDLGSDTMEKAGYITVRNLAAPVANFTASLTSGNKPLTVTFNDTSSNTPTSWLWTFDDGSNATVQNPVHTYSSAGNYTVSLNVTNDDGTNSVTKPDYIKVSNLPPTTLTTSPTTTVTTAVTTTVTTTTTITKPTPTKTHAPLSPVVAIVGIVVIGLFFAGRQKKNE
jgi:PKD repeat protein